MAWKDLERRKAYDAEFQRTQKLRRITKATALLGGHCVVCLTTDNLQFDHVDPTTKLFNIGSGSKNVSEKRFWAEVAKCQLLCLPHHEEKGKTDGSQTFYGESNGRAKLRELDVKYIRKLHELGHTQVAIAKEFGVSNAAVHLILAGKTWKHVT